jgi:hypothetical protein
MCFHSFKAFKYRNIFKHHLLGGFLLIFFSASTFRLEKPSDGENTVAKIKEEVISPL